jgi:hypothetical protein
LPWRGRRRVAGLAAELEDQNVINEGYLSSAECNALVVSACRAPLRKVTRLVRSPAGADDHMVTRFFFRFLINNIKIIPNQLIFVVN